MSQSVTKPAIGSTWKFRNETHKVVGFKTIYTGQIGVELVRFIHTKQAWAKTPICWCYLDEAEDPEYRGSAQFYDMFVPVANPA